MIKNNNEQHTMDRKWLEAIIVGVSIALAVVFVQPLVGRGDGWISVLGLLAVAVVICALQLALFFWNKPRR